MTKPLFALAAAALALPASAQAPNVPPLTLAQALASQVGNWTGKLEYRDYTANEWFGLPVKVAISDGGDGVTQIRVADFDDGPQTGIVRITTVSMLGKDGLTEYAVAFRKNREPGLNTARLTLTAARDAAHWTVISTEEGKDNNRPATIRLTTTRDGAALTTLKEVDFTDDAKAEWLVRNRTVLTKAD